MNKTSSFPEFERRGASSELVVLLHAYTLTRASLADVRRVTAEARPDADLWVPDLPTSRWSFSSPAAIVNDLLERIDRFWEERRVRGEPYRSMVLVGHSMGALFARKVFVCACGENPEAPFEDGLEGSLRRPWAASVERIILIAGMNRGWEINHHLSMIDAVLWSVGVFLGHVLTLARRFLLRPGEPIILSIRRGAPFLTELRAEWLVMRRQARAKGAGEALTIQLLGSIDDMVSPADNIDLISGRDFVYLDVPHAGHVSVIEFTPTKEGCGREAVFRRAVAASREELEAEEVVPADRPAGEPRHDVTDVVFVIHGIRDEGFWTHKIARRVREKSKAKAGVEQPERARVVETVTASYGYFPMLPFLLPWKRREKVEWFMDRYVEARALFPEASFSFVGHSNGTYLLANALERYRSCRFDRVVFAGSVVPKRYKWKRLIDDGQVGEVANYVATADWVVAWFPKALELLRLQDLGSAGHDGFRAPEVSQVTYVKGKHSAALQEANWDAIADFALHGGTARAAPQLASNDRSPFVAVPGFVAPLLWILLALVVGSGACALWLTHPMAGWPQWATTLAIVGYALGVRWVLMKL